GATGPQGPGSTGGNSIGTSTVFYSAGTTGPTGPVALSFPIVGGQNQIFNALLNLNTTGTGPTGGYFIGVGVPSGANVFAQIVGVSTGTNTQIVGIQTGVSAKAFNFTGATGPALIHGFVSSVAGVTGP